MPPRRQAVRVDLSGYGPVQAIIRELASPFGDSVERRLSRSALSAGMTELSKAIRRRVPKNETTARIRKAVGTRFSRNRRINQHEAKVGFNVGRKQNTAPHAHLYLLGTVERKTNARARRGKVKRGPRIVREAAAASSSAVINGMIRRVTKRFPVEVRRVIAKHRNSATSDSL